MSTAPVPAPKKESWLSKVGHVIGQILHVFATEAKPIADTAAPVIEALFPQFAPAVAAADALVTKIAGQALAVEATAAAAGQATGTGPQKLAQVVQAIGPSLDAWVQNAFPGAKAVSDAEKAGLVNAIVAIINAIEPPAAIAPPAAG